MTTLQAKFSYEDYGQIVVALRDLMNFWRKARKRWISEDPEHARAIRESVRRTIHAMRAIKSTATQVSEEVA